MRHLCSMDVGISARVLIKYYVRLLEWEFCLCLYTSTRMRGNDSRAKMQAATAKATGTEPGEATERLR